MVAVTGGIASGKSTVSRRLEEWGAVRIDADQLARDVVEPGSPALADIVLEFGQDILNEDGTLNRAALGNRVFSDAAERTRLEAITHPAIRQRATSLITQAYRDDPHAIVVYEIPLLVESRQVMDFDLVVVANADTRTRLDRMISLRGFSRAAAQQRLSAQAPETARLAVADYVINTDGTLEETYRQVDRLWELLVAQAR